MKNISLLPLKLISVNLAKATLCVIICTIIAVSALRAESSSWFVGIGGGYGQTQLSRTYSSSAKTGGLNVNWIPGTWRNQSDVHSKSWGFAFDWIVGYKHFLNDYLGLRYYANIGAQLYKDATFSNDKIAIGIVDYSANADLLVNFYDTINLSVGIYGGFGVGGAHFDSAEIKRYERYWGGAKDSTQYTQEEFKGVGEVSRNFFSATINAGVRASFYQQLRGIGQVVCKPNSDGRRTCSKPTASLEHSLEVGARFAMLPFQITKAPEVMGRFCSADTTGTNPGKYRCAAYRYGYEARLPYKILVRYVLAF